MFNSSLILLNRYLYLRIIILISRVTSTTLAFIFTFITNPSILNYNGKLIPDLLYFYWLDNKIISCKWKHSVDAKMYSDDEDFLMINGL